MATPDREILRKQFGSFTPAQLRERIRQNDGIDVSHAKYWMELLEEDERAAAVKRAEQSVEIARDAAQSSASAAKWAMWAAIVSVVGIVVQLLKG